MSDPKIQISVVIPVYKAQHCLDALVARLVASIEALEGAPSFEIVLVDDRSPDDSWAVIRKLAESEPRLRALRLSRNFGQHRALTAGLKHSRGGYIVVMDCDLQDPPEAIGLFYKEILSGRDVVYARRNYLAGANKPMKALAAKIYHVLLNLQSPDDNGGATGSFSMATRKVVDAFLGMHEFFPDYLLQLRWLGFNRGFVEVEGNPRHSGGSSYTFVKLVLVALNGLTLHTTLLIQGIAAIGAALLLAALVLLIPLCCGMCHNPGWSVVAWLVLLLGGLITTCLAILGLYIEKILAQTRGRPSYVVDTVLNG